MCVYLTRYSVYYPTLGYQTEFSGRASWGATFGGYPYVPHFVFFATPVFILGDRNADGNGHGKISRLRVFRRNIEPLSRNSSSVSK